MADIYGRCGDWRKSLHSLFADKSLSLESSYIEAFGNFIWGAKNVATAIYFKSLIEDIWKYFFNITMFAHELITVFSKKLVALAARILLV